VSRERTPSAGKTATTILRIALSGALATVDERGAPYASHVSVATTPAGDPILLLSRLALHTHNLQRDRRASLLVVDDRVVTGDPVAMARLSVSGIMDAPSDDPALRRRFLTRHPEAADYADFADFAFYRLNIERAHLVAGFGRIVDLAPAKIGTDTSACGALIDGEAALLDWLNARRPAGLVEPRSRDEIETGTWRATGIDPDGVDLLRGVERERYGFAGPVATGEAAREILAPLTARSEAG